MRPGKTQKRAIEDEALKAKHRMKLKSWPGIGSVGMSHGPPRSARNNGDTVCCNDSTKPSLPAEVLKCFELLLHGSLL